MLIYKNLLLFILFHILFVNVFKKILSASGMPQNSSGSFVLLCTVITRPFCLLLSSGHLLLYSRQTIEFPLTIDTLYLLEGYIGVCTYVSFSIYYPYLY